ncbi:MAG: hypothetical protein JOY77_08240 [Alphaproteobacteria bacterium]|nr:hypothetical protein [Alphaproteobacteria bacterium]MBV9062905.1 hypothetical protein [Alphaproteobacteria bacterium]
MRHIAQILLGPAVIFLASIAIVVGSTSAQAWTLTTLHAFCSDRCYDGEQLTGGLAMDGAGSLYGITHQGGVFNGGTAFQLSHDAGRGTWKYRVLYNFGGAPSGRFIIDTGGNLYGASGDPGAVFELTPGKGQGWTKKVIYKFCHRDSFCSDGYDPTGSLTYAGAESGAPYDGISPLFGTAQGGGRYHYGTVYSLTPTAKKLWHLRVLYAFCQERHCRNGWQPTGMLLQSASDLYVSTDRGGLHDMGTILKLSATDGKANKGVEAFYRFCAVKDCPDGGAPSGLTSDSVGNLLGNAGVGGANRIKDRCPRAAAHSTDWRPAAAKRACMISAASKTVWTASHLMASSCSILRVTCSVLQRLVAAVLAEGFLEMAPSLNSQAGLSTRSTVFVFRAAALTGIIRKDRW